ncbi:Hypothetical predicted protein [Mytilus galloprovincialis]|uniref:Uncharacterized protein n=1 Tax=Mytilus galloprovincialis TaxID=29158 RepID=A0A8B6H2X3_MYTGA|nr:Hypothetical predicted protein [Mytilus galloprovincialis]
MAGDSLLRRRDDTYRLSGSRRRFMRLWQECLELYGDGNECLLQLGNQRLYSSIQGHPSTSLPSDLNNVNDIAQSTDGDFNDFTDNGNDNAASIADDYVDNIAKTAHSHVNNVAQFADDHVNDVAQTANGHVNDIAQTADDHVNDIDDVANSHVGRVKGVAKKQLYGLNKAIGEHIQTLKEVSYNGPDYNDKDQGKYNDKDQEKYNAKVAVVSNKGSYNDKVPVLSSEGY